MSPWTPGRSGRSLAAVRAAAAAAAEEEEDERREEEKEGALVTQHSQNKHPQNHAAGAESCCSVLPQPYAQAASQHVVQLLHRPAGDPSSPAILFCCQQIEATVCLSCVPPGCANRNESNRHQSCSAGGLQPQESCVYLRIFIHKGRL